MPRVGLAVVDNDGTLVSGLVKGAFAQGALAEIVDVLDASDSTAVEKLFADEKAAAALFIPKGFSSRLLTNEDVVLRLYSNPRQFIAPQIAEGITGSLVALANGLLGVFSEPISAVQSYAKQPGGVTAENVADISRAFYNAGAAAPNLASVPSINVSVVEQKDEDDEGTSGFNMAALFFPGLLMFGLLSISLGIETRFLYDRLNKVTERFVTAPVRPATVVFGQKLYALTFIYAVAAISSILAGVIWRIPPHGLATASLIVLALGLFIAGINGIVFSFSNSRKATSAISTFVMMGLLIVGGGFFPAEFTPEGFQAISKWVPTGMANMGLTRALTDRELHISLPILFAYCGLFFIVSIVLGRRRLA